MFVHFYEGEINFSDPMQGLVSVVTGAEAQEQTRVT